MKNAMKKIMGLLLVAVLLVSVVPFQALAAEKDANHIYVQYKVEGAEVGELQSFDLASATVADLAKKFADADKYTSFNGYVYPLGGNKHDTTSDEVINKGDSIAINFTGLKGDSNNGAKGDNGQDDSNNPGSNDTDFHADTTYDVTVTVKTESGDIAQMTFTENAVQNSTAQNYLDAVAKAKGINLNDYSGVTKVWIKNKTTGNDGETVQLDKVISETTTLNIVLGEKEEPAKAIKVIVKVNSSDNVVKEFEKVPANGSSAKVGDLLTYGWNKDWDNVYEFDHAWSAAQKKELTKTQSVEAGDTLSIMLKSSSSSNGSNGSNGSTTNKFPYKVYLHVYLNNNIGEPDRNINITNTLATDGVVSLSEVKNLIPDYYKAKNSNGIGYDGLYLAKGNWVKDYVTDANKYEKLNDVDVRTGEEYVHINVMITNATAKTSSTADTSNPKTGDAIFMTITVMGLSAAALTGLFFYDKKRKAL